MATSSEQWKLWDVAKNGSEEEMRKFLSDRSQAKVNDLAHKFGAPLHRSIMYNRDMGVAKVQPTLNNTCIQN